MRGLLSTLGIGLLCLGLAAAPAAAIMSGDESTRARSGDSDYADGKEAFEAEDWPAAIEALDKVVARRPWHDNAHNMLGFSWRKLGDFFGPGPITFPDVGEQDGSWVYTVEPLP